MSRSLDCCKALQGTTTTLNRRYCWRLFHSVDEDSRELLYEVSSCCGRGIFSAEILHLLVFLQFLAFRWVIFLRRSQRYAHLSLTSTCGHNPSFLQNPYTPESNIYFGFDQIFQFAQMFVLAPRLILGVREYHAERVANPDTASAMASIVFQEHVHVTTNSGVQHGRLSTCLKLFLSIPSVVDLFIVYSELRFRPCTSPSLYIFKLAGIAKQVQVWAIFKSVSR